MSTQHLSFELDRLLPERTTDPIGALQVGLAVVGTILVIPAAALGGVPVVVGAPVVWGVVLLSIVLLQGMRTRRARAAWEKWASAFEAEVPRLRAAVSELDADGRQQAAQQLGQTLLCSAHRIPGLPPDGNTHLPHCARLLHWVADHMRNAAPDFSKALEELAENCAIRNNCCDN